MNALLQLSGAVADLVYRVAALPEPGGEVVASGFAALPGGGFNALVAARRAGMPVAYGGGIGTGPFADVVRAGLAAAGIRVLLDACRHADQGTCVVLVEPSGERSFVSIAGAEGELTMEMLAALPAAPWVLLSGYTLGHAGSGAALAAHVAALGDTSVFVFDPAPMVRAIAPWILRSVLARADWISANLAEAREMTGEEQPPAAAEALLRLCARAQGAVLRAGAQGCWLVSRHGAPAACVARHVPAFAVAPVDTNGAGDAHVGAFIAALHAGSTPPHAARFANAAAALSTTRQGPATAPELVEIEAFLATRETPLTCD